MKYCATCGNTVSQCIPPKDNRLRFVCHVCHKVHYQNPCNVVGTVPIWANKVLLCRRAIEPRYGFWTLPAGFMELGETTAQAAARETLEEAQAQVKIGQLFSVLNLPRDNQVHLFYLAQLHKIQWGAGEESLEVKIFDEMEIPWQELAFATVRQTLQCFFIDQARGHFGLHTGDIDQKDQFIPHF